MELNGLPAVTAFGSGSIKELPIIRGLVIAYNPKTDMTLYVIVYTFEDVYETYEDSFFEILGSISAIEDE